jgi:hypothetical protein
LLPSTTTTTIPLSSSPVSSFTSYYNFSLTTNLTHTIRHVIQILQHRIECLGVIKLCMIITLFVLLDVAWVSSDIRNKYHSADVNFVYGEYWHGGISNRVVVSSPDGGKIFNDDVVILSSSSSFVNHQPSTLDDTTTTTIIHPSSLAVAVGAVGGSSKERTTLIPPSLSYARSSTSSSYNHGSMKRATRPSLSKSTYSVGREEQTMTSTMAWSLWQAIRAIIWLVFALPVIETAVREIRRRRCISALSTRRTNNLVR